MLWVLFRGGTHKWQNWGSYFLAVNVMMLWVLCRGATHHHMAVWAPQMSCTLAKLNILTLECLGRYFKCAENQSDPVENSSKVNIKVIPTSILPSIECGAISDLALIFSNKIKSKRSSITSSPSQWVMMVIKLILVIQMIHRSFWSTSPFWCFHHHQKSIIPFISHVLLCQMSNLRFLNKLPPSKITSRLTLPNKTSSILFPTALLQTFHKTVKVLNFKVQ